MKHTLLYFVACRGGGGGGGGFTLKFLTLYKAANFSDNHPPPPSSFEMDFNKFFYKTH